MRHNSWLNRKVLEEYGPLPEFIEFFVKRIMDHQWMPNKPNHLLVNEYNAGQGIMPHIDAPALFGPNILSLSLLSDCLMKFTLEQQELESPSIDIVLRKCIRNRILFADWIIYSASFLDYFIG